MPKAKSKTSKVTMETINKQASCKALSGNATLNYEIGTDADDAVHIRITKNSGGGFFSAEWISLDAIEKALKTVAADATVSAHVLWPLFRGQSVNTPGYLLAALKAEGLLQPVLDSKRLLRRLPDSQLSAAIVNIGSSDSAPPKKKAAARKKAPIAKQKATAAKRKAAPKKKKARA